MGRAKIQIKRLQNTTNRQVTYSKRRNGLVKKAYELSVLCDVDVAIIMFSPSGRLSLFSSKRRVEDVLAHFLSMPEHERGKVENLEHLQNLVGTLIMQSDVSESLDLDGNVVPENQDFEDIYKEINRLHSELSDVYKKLRVFEGNPMEITSYEEIEEREKILEETLVRIQKRRQVLEAKYISSGIESTNGQICIDEANHDTNGLLMDEQLNTIYDWVPQIEQPIAHNFMDPSGAFIPRGQPPQNHYSDTSFCETVLPEGMNLGETNDCLMFSAPCLPDPNCTQWDACPTGNFSNLLESADDDDDGEVISVENSE